MGQTATEINSALLHKLKALPVFKYFGKKDIFKIMKYSTVNNYMPGEFIITEGSFDDRVYFLVTGKVVVEKHSEKIQELQRVGDIFGEMCIIDGVARSANVRALTDTICLTTDMSFLDSLNQDDKVAFSAVFYHVLAEVLAQRLRDTSQEVVRLKEELAAMQEGK